MTRNCCLLISGVLALAGCDSGEGDWVPSPQPLWVTDFAPDVIRLSWDWSIAGEVEGYRVERKTGGGAFEFKADINDPWTNNYNDYTVVQDTTYSYRVSAFRLGIFSKPSNTVTATAEDHSVTMLSPTSSDSLILGDTFTVTWDTNWPQFEARIGLSVDGGPFVNILHAWGERSSPWEWKVGGLNREQDIWADPIWEQCVFATSNVCVLRITDYQQGSPTDDSETFTITVTRTVTDTSPNGAETWVAGSPENITWTSTGVASVRIELSRDDGLSWEDIVASTDAAAGSYAWTVTGPASTECLVRVRDASYDLPEDASDAVFTITVP